MVMIPVRLLPLCLLSRGRRCTQTPSGFGSHMFSPKLKFFGLYWCCWSALHVPPGLGLFPGRSLSVWEGYIHWLAPAEAALLVTWSVAVTRRHPAGASVPAVWPAEWSPESSSVQSVGVEPQAVWDGIRRHKTGVNYFPITVYLHLFCNF